MNRRTFLNRLACSTAVFAAGAGLSSALSKPAERPNIVLIMTDDQGLGDMSWTGHPYIRTPHLDELRRQSLWFSQFHVSPTCAPTRCSIMTGRHEFFSGVTHTIFERERMSLNAFILPQALKTAGYDTAIFGKWHLGDEGPYQPNARGFDETFIHGGGGIGQTYPGSCGDAPNNYYFNPTIRHNGVFVRTRGFCTDVFFERALQWIDERRTSGAPFFCCLTPNAPHDPYHAPDRWKKRFVDAGLDDNDAGFCGMVENIDWNVGKVIAQIDEWGLGERTLILLFGDNGTCRPRLYDGGMRGGKGTPYEGGTRVGMLARWLGTIPQGDECAALTAHIDLYPTFCALAGIDPPLQLQLDGRSLLPLFEAPLAPWGDRMLFTHLGRWKPGSDPNDSKYKGCAVRTVRFRFVNNSELYDLTADPKEQVNVAAHHSQVVAALRAAYDDWWRAVLPCLENENPQDVPAQNPFKTLYWQQFGF